MDGNVVLDFDESIFEKLKETAKKDAVSFYGEEEKDTLVFQLSFHIDEINYEEGDLMICGGLYHYEKDFGSLSITIPLNDLDVIVKIIEDYVKKLNKVKNVLESVKWGDALWKRKIKVLN